MYEYDYENRITKIKKPGPTTVAEYAYNAFGRRIKKTDSIVSSQSKVYYYNDKWQVLK
jgi:YD repeat-containing protein